MSAVATPAALALSGIVKHFDGVPALRGASLEIAPGTVHGLVGQNGAGKSTLIKILAGIHAADAGTVKVHGVPQPGGVAPAEIAFIHQERLLSPTSTVAEALALGNEPALGPRIAGPLRLIDARRLKQQARDALREHFGIELPPNRLIGELSVAEQQIVQITRALSRAPRILVFDEPTAALVAREVDRLLATIDTLRARGMTVVYVSHYLNEIAQICDKVSVLRDGLDVAHLDARATPIEALVEAMIGAPVVTHTRSSTRTPGDLALTVRDLAAPGRFENVSFDVRRGEVVGITGLLGSGGKGVLRALFGLERGVAGAIGVAGRPVRLRRPLDAVRNGIAFVPEDRRTHGVATALSVRENTSLASLRRVSRFGLLARRRETDLVKRLVAALRIRTPGAETTVRHLSGGNQQKVALAKWLSRSSSIYLLDEPTVGVDVGAKGEIYRLLDELVQNGACVLLFSSDLIELLGVTDRVLVMKRGRIVRELVSRETNTQTVLAWAAGAREAVAEREREVA
ncbi:monosaccharide ABC transporter ATP-binding protein (CUT2 family) [Trinickia symbiotica]|uniref:Sugar ABC transporter n=1 Tax=Trinickia symbiotica TaxID=863227 RepID=A0A2N7X4U7_9BURK|nr:sugar ABC transporter ATP-binding protein [Trinickia symbiotica]PMS36601.1 sugar ABC transporter [Trinickia symbiotica]PPK46020.1 monosaccharide ABC transporter ATP-binding protein (CUT2 family) [Trinickia symbiotica]